MGEAKPLTAFQQTYHWRNKNCGPWAHKWVKENLPGLKVEEGGAKAEVVEVTSVSGDCDLGQRKGKLLTIYDLEIEAKWTGTTSEGEEANGTIRVPEFSHEVLDGHAEYEYQINLSSPSNAPSDQLLLILRKAFPPILSSKFDTFRPQLLEAHGIFISADGTATPSASAEASGAATPTSTSGPGAGAGSYAPAPPAKDEPTKPASPSPVAAAENKPTSKAAVGNTKSVEVSAPLRISAVDLWGLLTDQSRIPMWSRSAAKLDLKPEGEYELFGGNVRGQVKVVDAPNKLVQTWQTRNGSWPAEHYGTLTTTLAQGSDSTTLTLVLDGVPSGQESDIERALDTFYIRGLKQMGLGTIL